MTAIPRLQSLLRQAWDRRISHDYLAWMNDQVEDDEALWRTGERDFKRLIEGITVSDEMRAFEIGCGVGRLLRPAASVFEHVVGSDISSKAVALALEKLKGISNVTVHRGNGINCEEIEDASFDVVMSWGILSNIPVIMSATYLIETARVLKTGGYACHQVWVGRCQETVEEDTLAYRSFHEQGLREACEQCGLSLQSLTVLERSTENESEGWLLPYVAVLRKSQELPESVEENDLAKLLYPQGEEKTPADWPGSQVEYYLSVSHAEKLAALGKREEAKRSLQFAIDNFKSPDPKLLELLKTL